MKRRRNYDGKDRISDLPDCILLQILSHLKTKQAVQMSILSPRWKNLWKHISVLSFDHRMKTLRSLENLIRCVSKVLSLRDDKTPLQALNFECHDFIEPHILKRMMKDLYSHNVQQLHMTVACNIQEFPLCNFSSHTLTSLRLTSCRHRPLFPNSLKLPALTHLSLESFSFRSDDDYAEPFSVFKSLNTLIIHYCGVFKEQNLCEQNLFISSVSLVNLTMSMPIRPYKFKLSTPNLSSFEFKGDPLQNLCGLNSNFSSIKHVKIVLPPGENFPFILFNWLVELAHMESLTISSKTLKILNLIPDSWKVDFHYLRNLKLLKIDAHEDDVSSVHDGLGDFLLQKAPSAKKVINYLPRSFLSTCRRSRDQNMHA